MDDGAEEEEEGSEAGRLVGRMFQCLATVFWNLSRRLAEVVVVVRVWVGVVWD